MKEELKDLAWAAMPSETRKMARREYAYHSQKKATDAVNVLANIFGHHNLASDKEPEEMLTVPRKEIIELYKKADYFVNNSSEANYDHQRNVGKSSLLWWLFSDKCLPDPSDEKPTPKFKCGNNVVIVNSQINQGINGVIDRVEWDDKDEEWMYGLKGYSIFWSERALAPYTEPEPQQTEDNMEENKSGKEVDFPTKELNLLTLLKDCEGEKFYMLTNGEVAFRRIETRERKGDVIRVCYEDCDISPYILPNGKTTPEGHCILFPSRALYEKYPLDPTKAWQIWSEERKQKRWRANVDGHYWRMKINGDITEEVEKNVPLDEELYVFGNYFRTKEDAEIAAESVKRTLIEFHEKNAEK